MMSVTIDPSDARPAPLRAASPRRPVAPLLRTLALVTLGGIGLVGFSVGAYSMLGQLARPQPAKVLISHKAGEWPDLKDGIPAMAPASRDLAKPASWNADAAPPPAASAPSPIASTAPATPRKAAPPPMEMAAVVDPARLVPVVKPSAIAALVPPTSAETVRARAGETRVTALPPEPASPPAARPVAKKAPPAIARAKPATAPADAVAAAAPEPAEAEETEVFGVKVPTLASSGRKLVEGVQSLGNAVAGQF